MIHNLPVIRSVFKKKINLEIPFLAIAERFAMDRGTVALMSGGNLDCANYHILAVKPWLELTGRRNQFKIRVQDCDTELAGNPFDIVDNLVSHFQFRPEKHIKTREFLPVISGLFGYFSYDLKNNVEKLPQTCLGTELPEICLYAPSIIFTHDKKKSENYLLIPCFENSPKTYVDEVKNFFLDRINREPDKKKEASDKQSFISSKLKSTFSKDEYIEKVQQVIKYLKEGDIYQANLSQRFETGFSSNPFILFKKLYKKNPAAFFAYLNAENHQIISTSPERFIKRDQEKIETRPIKGTIARGRTDREDKKNADRLCSSIKDDAELTMIVDLMRNDLSRVAEPESVIVEEHKKLEPYENVFHLVSIVKGRLVKGMTSVDFLRAAFPGGSITGCPKIRSMEIIDELEPVQRHVYTGSIGYISFHDTMDLSIAIRTATVFNKKILFSVGGGIVFDSDPEKEYQETLDKGKTIMESLVQTDPEMENEKKGTMWVNGKFINKDKAYISINCPGFQYGAGLFETIKAVKGKVIRLDEHLKRLERGLKNLFNKNPLNINFEDIISEVLKKNDLTESTAAVKIMVAENSPGSEFPFYTAVSAREYIHRLDISGKEGIELVKYPYPRLTPVADHKSMNYLFYYLAGLYAKENKKDEAVILNHDNTVSETNTCNIMIVKDNEIILPESEHVLKGVTIDAAVKIMTEKGFKVKKRKIQYTDFSSYSNIILTNSLMGAVPVISIQDRAVDYDKKLLEMINRNIVGF